MFTGNRGAIISFCALASLGMMALGGTASAWSRDAVSLNHVLPSMSAMFLLFTTYFSLPFSISQNFSIKQAKTLFVLATILGLMMPAVVAISNPASYPPRLVNIDGLKQSPRATMQKAFIAVREQTPPKNLDLLRLRQVLS